jgi:hypothetical protein
VSAIATNYQGAASNTANATLTDAGPTITVSVAVVSRKTVTLTGSVTAGLDKAGLTISFSGQVTGSATTDANGNYSFTTTATALGNVTAVTKDSWGVSSNTAPATIACPPPKITQFWASEGQCQMWTFAGTVQDQSPACMKVTLSGLTSVQGKTATVQSDGSFSVTLPLKVGEDGTVYAQTTDWWGQVSNIDSDQVNQT